MHATLRSRLPSVLTEMFEQVRTQHLSQVLLGPLRSLRDALRLGVRSHQVSFPVLRTLRSPAVQRALPAATTVRTSMRGAVR